MKKNSIAAKQSVLYGGLLGSFLADERDTLGSHVLRNSSIIAAKQSLLHDGMF